MIGSRLKKRGLFGTPGINPQAQQPQMAMPPMSSQQNAPQEATKRGLFGPNAAAKMFALGGLLQGDGGRSIQGLHAAKQQQMAAQQEAIAAQAAALRKRSMDRQDKMWEWQNKPDQGTAMQQNYEYLQAINPEAADSYLERQTQPVQWITGPDGVPRPYGSNGPMNVGAPPSAPVGKLTPMGGAAGNGSGGFR